MRRLRERIRGVELLLGGDSGQYGGAPAGEKWRSEHQQSAEQIKQPGTRLVHGEDEAEGDHGAHQVARDHDFLAIQPVEHDTGDGARQDSGNRARKHHAADHQAGAGGLHHQAEDRDVVEVVADFADHLAQPRISVIGIVAQQVDEVSHGFGTLIIASGQDGYNRRHDPVR